MNGSFGSISVLCSNHNGTRFTEGEPRETASRKRKLDSSLEQRPADRAKGAAQAKGNPGNRIRLQLAEKTRDLALFKLAIDSKLRGCDFVNLRGCETAQATRANNVCCTGGTYGQCGALTIGAITSAILDVLPDLIVRLKAQYPGLTVSVKEIDSVDAIPALLAGDIDLAFARLEGDLAESIEARPEIQERLAVALPQTHPAAGRSRVQLALLAEEDFIMFSRRVSPVYFDYLIATCQTQGFSPRIVHEFSSVASQIAFAAWGQGIALVPSTLKKLAPENVVIRSLEEKFDVVTTAIAWNTARSSSWVGALVDHIRSRPS